MNPSSAAAWPRRAALGAALAAALWLAGCSSTPPRSPSTPGAAVGRLTPEQGNDITLQALGLVGTPYRSGGNTPDSGFDCSGLIGYVYRGSAGLALPRTVAQLRSVGQPVEPGALRSGDLVLFGGGRGPQHAGIYVGEGRFVHAPSSGGTVRLDPLHSGYWARQQPSYRRP